jgi:uncharacterized protein with HEPN domain
MLCGPQFSTLEEAGTAILTLVDGIAEAQFRASRLTRAEVRRQLLLMCAAAADLERAARERMPELEWSAWNDTSLRLQTNGPEADAAMWFAIGSLVPATLTWLRVYRKEQPGLFAAGT